MKNCLPIGKLYVRHCLVLLLLCFAFAASAQTNMSMSMTDFLNWQPTVANQDNISTVPLAQRVKTPNLQLNAAIDTNAKILYCPDGMNNFGPYIDSTPHFNMFNFTHWQYIDILAWFGGSAGAPILIPSKSWVDAAHKNGVKVIGTIFFAPTVYGGSQAQVQSFLVQDAQGHFIAAQQMKAIADYYHFDGWIFNAETQVNSATGALMSSFVNEFDSIYPGESIWYDSMLQSGTISYQNKLDANNAYFFQHSTGLFTNYGWSSTTTINSSNTYATSLGRSPFNVYTGADMWPNRNAQPAFSNYQWIDKIFQSGIAKTSIAAFAMNFTYNYAPYSTFNNDSTAYAGMYTTENKIFYGLDLDPFAVDNTWKGFGNYVAVRSTITSLPFECDFNTGQGKNYFYNGNVVTPGSWSNISMQDILPTWFGNAGIQHVSSYDFDDAFTGGSSAFISGGGAGNHNVPFYSTDIVTSTNALQLELAMDSVMGIDSIGIELQTKNGASSVLTYFHPSFNTGWEDLTNAAVAVGSGDTIVAINLVFHAQGAYQFNLGKIKIESGLTGLNTPSAGDNVLSVFPNPSSGIVTLKNTGKLSGTMAIYDLSGKLVSSLKLNANSSQQLQLKNSAVYLYDFTSGGVVKQGKIVVY